MNKLAILTLLLGFGLVGCESGSGAFDAYEEFAEALTAEDFDRALEMTARTSPAKAMVLLEKARKGLLSDSTSVNDSAYSLEAESVLREVTLTVRQKLEIEGASPGTGSVTYVHEAVLQETASGWKIVSFDRRLQE